MKYSMKKKLRGMQWLMLGITTVCLLITANVFAEPGRNMAYAQEETEWGEVFTYEHLGGKNIAITGMKDTSIRILEIPAEIDGYTVTTLAEEAFRYNDSLMWVEIPDTVTKIEKDVFSDCPNLMYLKVPSSVTSIGSGAFYHGTYVAAGVVDTDPDSYAAEVAREQGKPIYSELMEFIMADTGRYGRWDLTYKEFIELYQSIGTENDLFLKKLSETGTRHTEGELWFDYDGVTGIEVEFEDVVAEKIFALHYAPFDYNGDDLASGNTGKDCMEAYLDHGGVCGILADIYHHFLCVVLEEYDWQYRGYGNADVNHAVMMVMTEDGRCVQIDNCGVEAWWQGITLQPDYEKIGEYEVDPEVEEDFYVWKKEFETLEKKYWHTFSCWTETGRRPVRYNFDISELDIYMGKEVLKQFKCVFRGMEEIISMAGYMNFEGYADIAELGFDMSVIGNRPRKVHVTNGDAQVTIFWDEVEGATNYAVSQYEDGVYTVLAADITDTEYTVTDLTNGEQYTFLVQAFVDGEWSEISERNHIGGLPMETVPTEDENFYYHQSAKRKIGITGLKKTTAEKLVIPDAIGIYKVSSFPISVLYLDGLQEIYVPKGVSMILQYEDYERIDEITATVLTEDDVLLNLCKRRGIPYEKTGKKVSFTLLGYDKHITVEWEPLYGATEYRVFAWKDGEMVTVQEYSEEARCCEIWNLDAGTTYQVLVQAKVDGEWCSYTEEDLLSANTYYEEENLLYKLQEDDTFTIVNHRDTSTLTGTYVVPGEYNGKKITTIGSYTFYGGKFTEVILSENVNKTEMATFGSCLELERVYFPSTLELISPWTFNDCPNLKKVYLPNNITYIGKYAFDPEVIIYASAGSAAAEFAEANGYSFVEFDGKPEQLVAEGFDKGITITWNEVELAGGYLVTVYDAEGEPVWQEETTDASCMVTNLQNGMEYSITVQSVFGTMKSEVSEEDVVTAIPYSADGIFNFVGRLYEIILEREADAAGLEEWAGWLIDGTFTGAEVAQGFIMSEEFLNKEMTNEEFVKILYRAFFGREADEGGLTTWENFLNDGCKKNYVFAGFVNSNEFERLCAGYGITRGSVPALISDCQPNLSEEEYNVWFFAERMYTEVLNRTADAAGLQTWVSVLMDGTFTGAQVAEGFIMSEEFLSKELSEEEFVQVMYKAFFNREADPDGLQIWVDALQNGYSKEYIFAGFANSDEFGALCDSYGIVRGEIEVSE